MRRVLIAMVVMLLSTGAVTAAEAQRRRPDLTAGASGTATSGEAMTLRCDLTLVAVPSNVFEGTCEVTVGGDRLTVVASAGEGQHVATVVLNGLMTIRAMPETATGRFTALGRAGDSGFPVHIAIDPFRRAWTIRADGPSREAVAAGDLSAGRIVFAIP